MNKFLAISALAFVVLTLAVTPMVMAAGSYWDTIVWTDDIVCGDGNGWDAWDQTGPLVGGEALYCARQAAQ